MGQQQVLGAGDGQTTDAPPRHREPAGAGGHPSRDEPPLPPGERLFQQHVCRRSPGAAAGHPRVTDVEDLDRRRVRAGFVQGHRGGQVARHGLEAEGRQQDGPGGDGARAVALQDAAYELPLPGRVEVVRAGRRCRLHGRAAVLGERPDRRGEHVTRADQRAYRLRPPGVGHHSLRRADPLGERAQRVLAATGQHRADPAPHHRLGDQGTGEAGGTEDHHAAGDRRGHRSHRPLPSTCRRRCRTTDGQRLRVLHGRAKAVAATLTSIAAKTRAHPRTRHLDLALVGQETANDPRPVVLVGLSMGGMLAYDVAACLLDPSQSVVRRQIARFALIGGMAEPLLRRTARLTDRLGIPMLFVAPIYEIAADHALADSISDDPRGGGTWMPAGWIRTFLQSKPAVPPEQFRACPVILAQPDADVWTPPELSRPFLERIAGPTEIVTLHGASHACIADPGAEELESLLGRVLAEAAGRH